MSENFHINMMKKKKNVNEKEKKNLLRGRMFYTLLFWVIFFL